MLRGNQLDYNIRKIDQGNNPLFSDLMRYVELPDSIRSIVKNRSENPITAVSMIVEYVRKTNKWQLLSSIFYVFNKLFPVIGYLTDEHGNVKIQPSNPEFLGIKLEEYVLFVIRTHNIYMDHSLDQESLYREGGEIKNSTLLRGHIVRTFNKHVPQYVIMDKALTVHPSRYRVKYKRVPSTFSEDYAFVVVKRPRIETAGVDWASDNHMDAKDFCRSTARDILDNRRD